MLTLSATQNAIAKRPASTPIVFVVLTTWTDKAAETVENRFYFANRTLYYPYDGTDRLFRGLLIRGNASVGTIVRRLGELRPQTLTLELGNDLVDSDRLWTLLRGSKLYGATVEIARHFTADPLGATKPRSIPSADHAVIYRGDLSDAKEQSNVISLTFDASAPELNLLEALGAAVPRKDFGRRWPAPVGRFERMPLVTVAAGAQTTLAQPLTAAQLGEFTFTDCSDFPEAAAFDLWVNGEQMHATKRNGNTVTISLRGQGGTRASIHQVGDAAVVIAPVVLAVGMFQIRDVDELFVRAPSGEIVRLSTADFAQSFTPDGSTLTITADALRSLLSGLFVSANVTVQPAFQAT